MAVKTDALTRNRVRELRKERGMTQQQLADAVGVRRESIQSIERGRFDASLPNAFLISQALGLPIEEVFSYERGQAAAPSARASPRA